MLTVHIPKDHPCFPGHFVGQPILPGVLLLERVLAFAASKLFDLPQKYTLQNVKFLAAVLPGDDVRISLINSRVDEFKFSVQIERQEENIVACSGVLRVVANESIKLN